MIRLLTIILTILSVTLIFAQTNSEEETEKERPTIEWVSIPAGTFDMGSPENEKDRYAEEVQHSVKLSKFKMSKYEITFEQYDIFCEETGREKPDDAGWGRGKRPVININWNDTKAFADWMGCRLPTEAEWEYACRAGTTTHFNTGICLNTDQANYNGNKPMDWCEKGKMQNKTLPVGSFKPNDWGLYDMHGNVMEYCSDWYGDYPEEKQINPKGAETGLFRVARGGSWRTLARICRSANRGFGDPTISNDSFGFRLVYVK